MLTVKVTPDEGPEFDITIHARDALVWEKTTKDHPSFLDVLREPNMTDLYRLAHIAGSRQNLLGGQTLAEFEKGNDVTPTFDEEGDVSDEEPDPTRLAAFPELSSDSPSEQVSPQPSGLTRASALL